MLVFLKCAVPFNKKNMSDRCLLYRLGPLVWIYLTECFSFISASDKGGCVVVDVVTAVAVLDGVAGVAVQWTLTWRQCY